MKQFYKHATILQTPDGWALHLDGKPVRTPNKQILLIPAEKLAIHIAAEWNAQGEDIKPDAMPTNQIMMTIQDRVAPNRKKLETEILGFINTDLICYPASEPEIYAENQEKSWKSFRDYIETEFKSPLQTTTGLAALTQSPELNTAITTYCEKLDHQHFACLYLVTQATGSLFLALAFLSGKFANDDIFKAALIEDLIKDGIYMADTYGLSPDQERKRKILADELDNCRLFLDLIA